MMISDEPDEDADNFDDNTALNALLDRAEQNRLPGSAAVSQDVEWPPRLLQDADLNLDAATLTWFKQGHSDWRREIRRVLRAWISARKLQQAATSKLLLLPTPAVHGQPADRP